VTERSADYLRFSKVVGPATRLVVAGGYSAFDPVKRSRNEVLAETESASTIEAIVEALGFQDEGRMDWMTPGQPTLVFIRDREVLASVRCLLPGYVRCEEVWEGDVELLDDGQLQELLIGFAAGSVQAGLEARLELGDVARSIRHRFGLSPMRFEDCWTELMREIGSDVDVECCWNCLFSDYSPGGHSGMGMSCHRSAKEQYLAVRSKQDYWSIPVTEEIPENYRCAEWTRRIPGTGYRG
jgi:hypothetical protein